MLIDLFLFLFSLIKEVDSFQMIRYTFSSFLGDQRCPPKQFQNKILLCILAASSYKSYIIVHHYVSLSSLLR